MADTLTQLAAKLQALLLDNGTLFSTATATAAIRAALADVNLALPVHAATTIDVVAGQYVYELTEALAGAVPLRITDVLLESTSVSDYETPLDFDQYIEDERWFFRLHSPQSSGSLLVRFSQAHTINGLDSATESTLPAIYDPVLLDGAAAEACSMAAAGKIEANNVDPAVPKNYISAAKHFTAAFNYGLEALKRTRPNPASVPDTRTWEDQYHNWPQGRL